MTYNLFNYTCVTLPKTQNNNNKKHDRAVEPLGARTQRLLDRGTCRKDKEDFLMPHPPQLETDVQKMTQYFYKRSFNRCLENDLGY